MGEEVVQDVRIGNIHIIGASLKERKVLLARRLFAERYAGKRGWNVDDLTFDQLMEIRDQSEWKNPDKRLKEMVYEN